MAMRCQRKGLDRIVSTLADNGRSNFPRRDLCVATKWRGAPQYVLFIPALNASLLPGLDDPGRCLMGLHEYWMRKRGDESQNFVVGQDRLFTEGK